MSSPHHQPAVPPSPARLRVSREASVADADPAYGRGEPSALLPALGPRATNAWASHQGLASSYPGHHGLEHHYAPPPHDGFRSRGTSNAGHTAATGDSVTASVAPSATTRKYSSAAAHAGGTGTLKVAAGEEAASAAGAGTGLGSAATVDGATTARKAGAGGVSGGSGSGGIQHPYVPFDLTVMRAARKSAEELKKLRPRALREFYEEQNGRIDFYEEVEEARAAAAEEAEAALKAAAAESIAAAAAAAAATGVDASGNALDLEAGGSGSGTLGPEGSPRDGGAGCDARTVAVGSAGTVFSEGTTMPVLGNSKKAAPAPGSASASAAAKAEAKAAEAARTDWLVSLAINASFAANVVLLAVKVYAAATSNSLAVIASTVDSVMDLISGGVVWLSTWLAARRNPYLFPVGKARYEPISIIVFAALMGAASLQLISQGATDLANGYKDGGGSSDADARTYGILASIIVVKGLLYLFCAAVKRYSSSVGALALDHFADIVTNSVPLAALLIIHYYPVAWALDPIAAILMSLYMVWMWVDAAKSQISLLTGQAATPREVGEVTFLALTHSPAIVAVDTVLCYQLGNKLQVEVDIVLPRDMILEESHDIGESLQRKVEGLINVERCFVHADYDVDHGKDDEHYPPWLQPAYAPPE